MSKDTGAGKGDKLRRGITQDEWEEKWKKIFNKKAKKILKWRPKYSGKIGFIKGLKETVEWFDNSKNLSQYKSKLYNY